MKVFIFTFCFALEIFFEKNIIMIILWFIVHLKLTRDIFKAMTFM